MTQTIKNQLGTTHKATNPVLLTNKANAAVLRNVFDRTFSPDAVLSKVEFRAFEMSTHGGVKVCALAGAIFNNEDEAKDGQGERHVGFMTVKLGKVFQAAANRGCWDDLCALEGVLKVLNLASIGLVV
ncbi:hypothetical protein B0H13DRAFT_1885180 [Mycena leptocephala]|nr:hypothetical protein B0H13DRAFT_1885180 [Mycena leptocephala]